MPSTAMPLIAAHRSPDAKHHAHALTYSRRRGLDDWVFRTNVTGDFGNVTEDFGPS